MTPRNILVSAVTLSLVLAGCSALTQTLENPDSSDLPSTTSDSGTTSPDQQDELTIVSEGPFSDTCDLLVWGDEETLATTRSSGRSVTLESQAVTVTERTLPSLEGDRINALDELCPGVVLAADNGGETILTDLATGQSRPSVVLERSGTIERIPASGIESGGGSYGIRDLVITPTSTYYSVGVVDEEAQCLRMEVRRLPTDTLITGADTVPEIIYESDPCVDFSDERRDPAPLKIHLGGALAIDLLTDTVYLTIGDYHLGASRISQAQAAGIESTEEDYALLLDGNAAISALVAIVSAGSNPQAQVFSKGLRNPLGLSFDEEGGLWLSEMGPGGGDEINRVVAGADYGWPLTSPGAPYDRSDWPDNRDELPAPFLDFSNQDIPGTTPPLRHWTPAIAPSALDFLPGDATGWGRAAGTLVMATLRDQAIHLLDISTETAETVFRIGLERRLRDMVVTSTGDIVSVTDEETLIVISPQ